MRGGGAAGAGEGPRAAPPAPPSAAPPRHAPAPAARRLSRDVRPWRRRPAPLRAGWLSGLIPRLGLEKCSKSLLERRTDGLFQCLPKPGCSVVMPQIKHCHLFRAVIYTRKFRLSFKAHHLFEDCVGFSMSIPTQLTSTGVFTWAGSFWHIDVNFLCVTMNIIQL